ncbi:ATP-binding cassette domain-containing protein [Pseudomonas stutzeri]|nr:ATP-binding cassette domain-containing protein [Stutzerimonas stutzeri]
MKRLHARDLAHAFGRDEIFSGIDFSLDAGEIVALVGPSGCGKTTLLRLCAGLLDVQDGRIENAFDNPASMFQQPSLLPWKTTLDNIALGLKARGIGKQQRLQAAEALALRLGLATSDLGKFPHQLSGGMQSRVSLARALALQPDLLLLDEPFAALDIGLKEELYALLLAEQAARGMGVLMITHDLMEAVRLADRILVMAAEPGRIVSRLELGLPALQRDDAWIYRQTAELLQLSAVRDSFGLTPRATPASDAGQCTALRETVVTPLAAKARSRC